MTSFATREVGRTGLEVCTLGFGGAGIGNLYRPIDDAQARAAVRDSLAGGVRYFDTAPFYGFGLSELRLGAALGADRASVVISTKVGRRLVPTGEQDAKVGRQGYFSPRPFEPVFDYSYDAIRHSHEESLERLGTDHVDILLVHDIGKLTHGIRNEAFVQQLADGGYRALRELRDSGAVRAIGVGVNECEAAVEMLSMFEFDCVLLAGRYTLLEQPALDALLPLCERQSASILCGGPFNSGVLATGSRAGAGTHYDYAPPPAAVLARVAQLEALCEEFGASLQAAALQFPLAHPRVATVVAGAASGAESRNIVEKFTQPVPPEFWRALRERGLVDVRAPLPA